MNYAIPTRAGAANSRSDGEKSRDALLEAAIVRFGADGFTATTARGITRDVGANVSAIKYYFGDKAGLYLAAVETCVSRMGLDAGSLPQADATSPAEQLGALVAMSLARAAQVRTAGSSEARLLLRAAEDAAAGVRVPGLPELVRRHQAPIETMVAACLARLVPRADDARLRAATSMVLMVITRFTEAPDLIERFPLGNDGGAEVLETHATSIRDFVLAGAVALLTSHADSTRPGGSKDRS